MKRKRKWSIIGAVILCLVLLGSVGIDIYRNSIEKTETEQNKIVTEVKTELPVPQAAPKPEPVTKEKEKELPVPDIAEPVTTEPVIPKDTYILSGGKGKLKCYFEDAQEYKWEYYDPAEKEWKAVGENTDMILTGETDELNRDISTLCINRIDEDMLIRCRLKLPEDDTEKIFQVVCSILKFKKEDIKDIALTEQFVTEAGSYLSVLDIPVKIIKMDGREETITGLSDLFFCVPKGVSADTERNNDGTTVETVTTTSLEKEYQYIPVGENNILLRYRGMESGKDMELLVKGTDSKSPEIKVAISDYSVSSKETEPITISAEISAEDNYTPLTKLLYAFLQKEKEVADTDFTKKNKIDIETAENGIWTAYVKDEAGNIGTADVEIITVDQKAPVIETVELTDTEADWVKENIVKITAKDSTAIEYCYRCPDKNMDSGWIDANEYTIAENGTWNITVRDAAGNESTEDITVVNIDSHPPVILSVDSKKEEPEKIDTGTLEDRVSVTVNGADVKASTTENQLENGINSNSSTTYTGSTTGTGTISPGTSYGTYGAVNNLPSERSTLTGSTVSSGAKGEKGDKGDSGSSGASGKDGTSYYMFIKYADNANGANMSDSPTDNSKYIGVYTGTQSMPPAAASSYRWSQYKGSSSNLFIRFSDSKNGANMTENAADTSEYIGICSTTDITAPDDPEYYQWSRYKDTAAITELQGQIDELKKQIENIKTTP